MKEKKTTEINCSGVADHSNLSNIFLGGIWEAFSCFVAITHSLLGMSITSFSDMFHITVTFHDK